MSEQSQNPTAAIPVTPGAHQPVGQSIELADIHLPGKPEFWPPAPGWWILALILLSVTVLIVLKVRRFLRLKQRRKQVMQALAGLEKKLRQGQTNAVIAEMNILLRRLALMHYPHKQIASLTGKDWLQFLDQSGQTTEFSQGAGRILADAPYLPQMPESFDVNAFSKVVKNWVERISVKPAQTQGARS